MNFYVRRDQRVQEAVPETKPAGRSKAKNSEADQAAAAPQRFHGSRDSSPSRNCRVEEAEGGDGQRAGRLSQEQVGNGGLVTDE